MKIRFFILTLILSITHNVHSQTETCLQNLNHSDLHKVSQVIGSDTIIREFILKIPSSYEENNSTPLIINMHGFGDCASEYAVTIEDFYNFSQLSNEQNIIVAYPQGAYRPEKEDTYWEPGDNGIENILDNDVYFIDKLISKIESEYNINSDMIFACGYSNGGMMAYSLACNRSSIFSAIGIMSGTMLQEDCFIDKPIPIIKFHGIDDGVLPYNGSYWYQSVEEIVSYWINQNNIPSASLSSFQLNDGKVKLDSYTGGDDNSCFSLYTIYEEYDKSGDHVWFSDDIDGISPNMLMWNFFEDNCSSLSSSNELNNVSYKIYPIPAVNQIKIQNANNEKYRLYDFKGKLILDGTIRSNLEMLSIESLNSGYYILSLGDQISKILKLE